MSPASAADRAPQLLTSTISASGRVCVTTSVKSATSYSARRQNTSTAIFSAARGFEAFQSSWTIASIRGSMASVVKPSLRPISTPVDSVRR